MPNNILSLELRKQRGVLMVQAIGQTPRGTRFLKQRAFLSTNSPKDETFKAELAEAVQLVFAWGKEKP